MKNSILIKSSESTKLMSEMFIGEIGIITEGMYKDEVIMSCWGGITVCLSDPAKTWLYGNTILVSVLPKGTDIVITVGKAAGQESE